MDGTRFGISRPAPITSSKLISIISDPNPIFLTPETKAPSVDQDFTVMFYNYSKPNYPGNSDVDGEYYDFEGNKKDKGN